MLAAELNRVFVHVRWPVQSYVVAGFFFGLVIAGIPLSGQIFLAFTAWLLLCAGLTVFNSYYDKDEEPVGGMGQPPKVTTSLLYGSLIMQGIALLIAYFVNIVFFSLAVLVAVLYFFYSHKSFRLKSNGYAAVLLNSFLGFLTILAAASVSGRLFSTGVIFGALTAAFFKASVYMMMQVHQVEADKVRGDISIAVMIGREKTLRAALVCMVIAGILGVITLIQVSGIWFIVLAGAAYFLLMDWLFIRWLGTQGDPDNDFRIMTRMIYVSGYLGSVLSIAAYVLLNMEILI